MEAYDPKTVFSSIDHHGRYAYGQQPGIAQWNLARLAEALLPLIKTQTVSEDDAVAQVTDALQQFAAQFNAAWVQILRHKLGLAHAEHSPSPLPLTEPEVETLTNDWLDLLQRHHVDWTLAWRYLADGVESLAAQQVPHALLALMPNPDAQSDVQAWLARWRTMSGDPVGAQAATVVADMRAHNPLLIPRNHHMESVLQAATTHGDLKPFESWLAVLKNPTQVHASQAAWAEPAPAAVTAQYQTFCGT
jgi:serine/tyrosine/threonine adenylyltransferase